MASTPIPDQTLPSGATSFRLDLTGFFDVDAITGTVVKLTTDSKGKPNPLFIELFDRSNAAAARTTPLTAANFLGYVDSGAYDGAIFHRLPYLTGADGKPDRRQPFVLQGGGFKAPATPGPLGFAPPVEISKGPTVLNEPGNPNVVGTIAMAKIGGSPNSATNQFFFNLRDNRSILDGQNGGFTVFGQLLGNGLAMVRRMIAGVSIRDLITATRDAFDELPLQRYKLASGDKPQPPVSLGNYLAISRAERVDEVTYTVKAKGAQVSISPTGELELQWRTAPTKPVQVSVQASSLSLPREVYRDTFFVMPAMPAQADLLRTAAPFSQADSATPTLIAPVGTDPLAC